MGAYDCTDEIFEGLPVFRKRDDKDLWLLFKQRTKSWSIRTTALKYLNAVISQNEAELFCGVPCLPEDGPERNWRVGAVLTPSLLISTDEDEEPPPRRGIDNLTRAQMLIGEGGSGVLVGGGGGSGGGSGSGGGDIADKATAQGEAKVTSSNSYYYKRFI